MSASVRNNAHHSTTALLCTPTPLVLWAVRYTKHIFPQKRYSVINCVISMLSLRIRGKLNAYVVAHHTINGLEIKPGSCYYTISFVFNGELLKGKLICKQQWVEVAEVYGWARKHCPKSTVYIECNSPMHHNLQG